ncbi:MAG TPA: HipA domain-containing protein [Bdellovibrionales bacterium]|nr:HipA domain-containing protein [Bdellovibrionales bacterium]
MPSKQNKYTDAYVWMWLPGETEPVVAGKLTAVGNTLVFNYGRTYLERPNRISIYEKELPLHAGYLPLLPGLAMPGCIRDGAPDAWGRRVLVHRKFGSIGKKIDTTDLDELTFLLESGSDRVGALDFQLSPTSYQPRNANNVSLDELGASAEMVEKGVPLTEELATALHFGSPIGGARPKALVRHGETKYIAKFSSTSDIYGVVKAEFIAMRLAAEAGLNVASVKLARAAHKDVLLIERFDRVPTSSGDFMRKCVVSALTLLELDEMMARYASYENLCEIIRHRFAEPRATLHELFRRLAFNILCGNTDDHARNHAAFWDGHMLTLTPAYDICPQTRTGNEVNQSMLISGDDHRSQLELCLTAAKNFQLSRKEALKIILGLTENLITNFDRICDEGQVSPTDRNLFRSRQFLNPYVFEGLTADASELIEMERSFHS